MTLIIHPEDRVSIADHDLVHRERCDVVVIGAGFYGCEIALKLKKLGCKRVVLAECRDGILQRASFVNQARIHNGYHYPRSLSTATRSHANFKRFLEVYPHAVLFDTKMVYAIAKGSRVSASQFVRFCLSIGASCDSAPRNLNRLFAADLIEDTFLTQELAFNASQLTAQLTRQLLQEQVDVRLGVKAKVIGISAEAVTVALGNRIVDARFVFNCTYGDLSSVGIDLRSKLKRELAELVLIKVPSILENIGITVMDGPFFSTMPFPALGLHSLSHVRHTPHWAITDMAKEELTPTRSNRVAMLRDASRFVPCLAAAVAKRSLFEIKTTLLSNENDDGRPILIEQSPESRRIYSILGSKIDNIFDALIYIESRDWSW